MISKTSKLLSMSPLLLLLVACGKKVETGSSQERIRLGLDLPETLLLEASATGGFSRVDGFYTIEKDGDVQLPLEMKASGATAAFQIKLSLNLIDGEHEFECLWKGTGDLYRFVSCSDPDGRDLGLSESNLKAFSFPIDQGKQLRLRLEAAPTGSTVTATAQLPVTWK